MMQDNKGRSAQRSRTRKAIVEAAAQLLQNGARPGLDEIAAKAEVSRATAYRYFPGLEALLGEAAVHALVPEPEAVLGEDSPADPIERLALVDGLLDSAAREREVALRLMLARSMEQAVPGAAGPAPLRQNRRVPLIERALEPAAGQLPPERRTMLVNALAMIIGTEGFIALTDVLGLSETEARATRRWAIAALLGAALDRPAEPAALERSAL